MPDGRIQIKGTIEDIFGEAIFNGFINEETVYFTKEYNDEALNKGAHKGKIHYFGVKKGEGYEGCYSFAKPNQEDKKNLDKIKKFFLCKSKEDLFKALTLRAGAVGEAELHPEGVEPALRRHIQHSLQSQVVDPHLALPLECHGEKRHADPLRDGHGRSALVPFPRLCEGEHGS